MEYLILPVPDGGYVAINLDSDWCIWSSKTGNTTFLGLVLSIQDAIEVDASFADVMQWFDHYIEPGNTAEVSVQPDVPKSKRSKKTVRLIETTN